MTKAGLLAVGSVVAVTMVGCRCRRVVVHGSSMQPTLEAGDRLLVIRAGRPRAGHLVVVPDPRQPDRFLVKRVAAVGGGSITVRGDNPVASTDSREFGALSVDAVRGRAVYRYAPPSRTGWLC